MYIVVTVAFERSQEVRGVRINGKNICQLMGTAPGVETFGEAGSHQGIYVHCRIHNSLPLQC